VQPEVMSSIEARVKRRCETEHAETIERIGHCADATASMWPESVDGDRYTTDRNSVSSQLTTVFDRAGVRTALVSVLTDLCTHIGEPLPAQPVSAPPYVVISTTGPMVRATLPSGRLVVQFMIFEIDRSTADQVRILRKVNSGCSVSVTHILN